MSDEGLIFNQGFAEFKKVGFGDKKKRLPAQHLEIALVENVDKKIGRIGKSREMFQTAAEALNKLTVLFRVLRFHDADKIILPGELFFEGQKISVVWLVGTHQGISIEVKLEVGKSEPNRERKKGQLGPNKPIGPGYEGPSDRGEYTRHQGMKNGGHFLESEGRPDRKKREMSLK